MERNQTIRTLLEQLFRRGYEHGLTNGKSNDKEYYAVEDTYKLLADHIFRLFEDEFIRRNYDGRL